MRTTRGLNTDVLRPQWIGMLSAAWAAVFLNGCSASPGTFSLVGIESTGKEHHFEDEYDEACFDTSPEGDVRIVLVRRIPPGFNLPPAIRIASITATWQHSGAKQETEDSPIEAKIKYTFGNPLRYNPHFTSFEGSGTIKLEYDSRHDVLTGIVEQAKLELPPGVWTPVQSDADVQLPQEMPPGATMNWTTYSQIKLSGRFYAVREAQRLNDILSEMNHPSADSPTAEE